MKTLRPLEFSKEIIDVMHQDKKIHQGNPELVNFPSTAEIYYAVFDNSCHACLIGNIHGQTIEVNEMACKIFGYSLEEMLRLSLREIFDTAESSYANYLKERNLSGKARAEIIGIKKNAQRFPCELSSVVFVEDNGERRTINTIQDISNKITLA